MKNAELLSVLASLSIIAGLVPRPAGAADPFYTRLLERGVRDLEIGQAAEAQGKLRMACFGFLDEPPLLAEGLIQLGRAQALAGNRAGLSKTLERLVEIEDRFGAYSGSDDILKGGFEASVQRAVPEAMLEQSSLFRNLTVPTTSRTEQIGAQTAKQRKRLFEQRLAANPDDAETLLAMARMHLADGKLKPADRLVDRLLAVQPGYEDAVCLRAEIAIGREECSPVLAGFETCPRLTASNQGAAVLLECLIAAQRAAEAVALFQALPIERRQTPMIVRAAGEIENLVDPFESPVENLLSEPENNPDLTSEAAYPVIKIGLTLEERMRRLRTEVAESRFRENLETAMGRAIELAADYPDSTPAQYLAAKVAYLASDWQLVLEYFARGGRPSLDQPELLFYLAVATYELGDPERADSILREALPSLPRSSFVDGYIDKILIPPQS